MKQGGILKKRNGFSLRSIDAIRNIIAWSEHGGPTGGGFYNFAIDICEDMARESGKSIHIVAGIVAALSPQTAWDDNILAAKLVLQGKTPKMQTKARINKALLIRDSVGLSPNCVAKILNGPKTTSFFWNILGDEYAVTVDSHAVTCAICPPKELKRDIGNFWPSLGAPPKARQYKFLANCYRDAAKKLKTTPSELQARTWAAIRKAKGRHEHQIETVSPF